jgi:small subunit ribosomal protein S20
LPNKKSAKKRVKTNARNEMRNRAAKSAMKTAIKHTQAAIGAGEAQAGDMLTSTQGLIARLWKRGIIHKNKAARLQSRLMTKAAQNKGAGQEAES